MSDRHALAPLRRWLIDSGTPAKLAVLLILAVLMIATSVVLLTSTTDGGDSGLIEIETPAG
ncbi:hypothetical protein E1262_25775 [Jiangella aurantiaca]|uniref:Uncharacterized protein n=1 Tax=Jiangella aurantiaca TaxID=2530373 RepID=A0A4V2YRA0_9ACTN|nr:hypothetical protein [Jiangella aurantiaca]TDD65277.1 hypothetical protein E1262_25775 [Jiangella aurantiaca]